MKDAKEKIEDEETHPTRCTIDMSEWKSENPSNTIDIIVHPNDGENMISQEVYVLEIYQTRKCY